MLNAGDYQPRSYLEITDSLRQHGASPDADIQELWRRIVFNVMVSNTDDHLRNHGFHYVGGTGWRLSPAYDLNPVPVEIIPRTLSTTITFDSSAASLELALEVAEEFGLKPSQAKTLVREVCGAVVQWQQTAKQLGINEKAITKMASAFENSDLEMARKF